MNDIKVSIVSTKAIVGYKNYNLSQLEKFVKSAAKQKSSIICFPELNISGYCNCEKILTVAESIPGPSSTKLCELSKENNITILAGIAEKDHNDNIYASHIVVQNDKIQVYRKLHLAPPEKNYFTQGNDVALFKKKNWTFGIQLCYDAHFPELSTFMATQGADIIFFPHASPLGTSDKKFHSWMRHLTARAYDNSVYVLACNQNGNNTAGLDFPGVIMALDPSGNLILKNLTESDNMSTIMLNKNQIKKIRSHKMRYFLPNRRTDLFC